MQIGVQHTSIHAKSPSHSCRTHAKPIPQTVFSMSMYLIIVGVACSMMQNLVLSHAEHGL